MNLRHFPFFTALLFGAVCLEADAYSYKQTFSETHAFQSDGTLKLSNVNGSVEVRTWDRNEIKIEGEKSAKSEEELGMIRLKIEPSPDRVVVDVKLPRRKKSLFGGGEIRANVEFTITVPAGAELDRVSTVNGSVTVKGVRGRIEASTVNGRVRAMDTAGDVSLETVNGGIDAQVASLGANGKIKVECVNGGITVRLPADAGATLDASVVNGGIDCDFPITLKSGHSSRRHLRGAIGSGQAEVKASTVNGGVKIQRT